ncbi:MAG: hypothetical protein E4H09_00020 [Spirochaetales bacterium]|nr:MAG: hypothetical protein E4H09_00020 [Spirochaetales bacterium]
MNLNIDTTRRHQIIDNFGASQAWWVDIVGRDFPAESMERIADLLFDREKGIGLSATRFNIGAGSESYDTEYVENWFMRSGCFQCGPNAPFDWSAHEGQRRLLKMARDRGVERTIAFVNSPPAWMTMSGHTRGDEKTGSTNLKPGMEMEFGRFLARIMKHFEDEGLPFDYLSPINEPQVPWDTPKQEGCRYSNQDMTVAVLAVRAALDEAGVKTPILFNETNNLMALIDLDIMRDLLDRRSDSGAYPDHAFQHGGKFFEGLKDVFWNPAVKAAIAPIVAAHSYGSEHPDVMIPVRRMTKATMDRYPGYDYWMTEYCVLGDYGPKRDLGIDAGLFIANVIHHDLVELDAAAWQWWLGVSGSDYKDGLVYLDVEERRVHDSKMLWALGHWSRFLRPGSVRVELQGSFDPAGLLGSAYLDAQGKTVVVLINQGTAPVEVTLEGADQGAWHTWTTDQTRSMEAGEIGERSFSVPPRSLLTLVGQQG